MVYVVAVSVVMNTRMVLIILMITLVDTLLIHITEESEMTVMKTGTMMTESK